MISSLLPQSLAICHVDFSSVQVHNFDLNSDYRPFEKEIFTSAVRRAIKIINADKMDRLRR